MPIDKPGWVNADRIKAPSRAEEAWERIRPSLFLIEAALDLADVDIQNKRARATAVDSFGDAPLRPPLESWDDEFTLDTRAFTPFRPAHRHYSASPVSPAHRAVARLHTQVHALLADEDLKAEADPDALRSRALADEPGGRHLDAGHHRDLSHLRRLLDFPDLD